jgi:hypothetical protein
LVGADAVTVIVATALLPSLVTVIRVVPALTPVTRPSELTDAMAGLALEEVTTRPVSTLLLASNADTWSCTVAPICRVADAGETVTDATGGGDVAVTDRGAVPVFPSVEAEITVEPGASAVTTPESVNVAALALLEVHTTAGPVTTLLLESRSVAVARSV